MVVTVITGCFFIELTHAHAVFAPTKWAVSDVYTTSIMNLCGLALIVCVKLFFTTCIVIYTQMLKSWAKAWEQHYSYVVTI